jgi:hypothetical protein
MEARPQPEPAPIIVAAVKAPPPWDRGARMRPEVQRARTTPEPRADTTPKRLEEAS